MKKIIKLLLGMIGMKKHCNDQRVTKGEFAKHLKGCEVCWASEAYSYRIISGKRYFNIITKQ